MENGAGQGDAWLTIIVGYIGIVNVSLSANVRDQSCVYPLLPFSRKTE